MKFTHYSDPSHGWVKVHIDLIEKLGISAEISPYSYLRKNYAYLEEDCDLGLFWKAMEKAGKTVELRYSIADKRSKIRGYEAYYPIIYISNEDIMR